MADTGGEAKFVVGVHVYLAVIVSVAIHNNLELD